MTGAVGGGGEEGEEVDLFPSSSTLPLSSILVARGSRKDESRKMSFKASPLPASSPPDIIVVVARGEELVLLASVENLRKAMASVVVVVVVDVNVNADDNLSFARELLSVFRCAS